MHLLPALCLAAFGSGCARREPPPNPPPKDQLGDGVSVNLAGCPFVVRTPDRTTPPLADDGVAANGVPRSLHLSYTGDPRSSISIVWITDLAARGTRIEWGEGGRYDRRASGFSFAYGVDQAGEEAPSVRVHEVHLCGLPAGSAFSYRIAGTAQGGHFTTAPAQPGRPVKIAVTGDSRNDPATFGAVLRAVAESGAELLVYTGDAVVFGAIQQEWDDWFAAGKAVFPSLPIAFALGNHEARARHFFAQFAQPGNEEWFGFDFGDAHLVLLNDSPGEPLLATIAGQQAELLDRELSSSRQPWRMVAHHRPIYSASDHGSQRDLQQAWLPLYDKHSVDVVWSGHDHTYERSKPMRAGVPVGPGKGTLYIVNGGGGAPLYSSGRAPHTEFAQATYGFSLAEVAGRRLTITSYAVAGGGAATPIDRVTLNK